MKRIVMITTSFPRTIAGSESAGSFVEDFSAALGRHCELTVVAPGFSEKQEVTAGYTVQRYPAPERALSQLKLWSPRDALQIMGVMRHAGDVTARVVATVKPDFVFALWALPSGYWAWNAVRSSGVPYGTWCLGSDIWSLGRVPLIRSLLRFVLRKAQYVFADGYELAAQVNALAGVECRFLPSSRKLPVRHSSTELRDAPPYRLLFIGRWHPNKGTDLLMEALALLDDTDWGLIEGVRIYGGGPLEPQVHDSARNLQAAGRPVQVFGYIDKYGAALALAECDWLLIPSRIESIPVVFSDAMQTRRPVISMPVGDLSKLVRDFDVGMLATDVSAAAFANAIRDAMRQGATSYRANLSEAAQAFEVEGSVRQLLQVLQAPDNSV